MTPAIEQAVKAITREKFIEATGREPEQYDLERCNCDKAGEVGHWSCGWNYQFNKPVFEVGAGNPALTEPVAVSKTDEELAIKLRNDVVEKLFPISWTDSDRQHHFLSIDPLITQAFTAIRAQARSEENDVWKQTVRNIFDMMHGRKYEGFCVGEKATETRRTVIEYIESRHHAYFCEGEILQLKAPK